MRLKDILRNYGDRITKYNYLDDVTCRPSGRGVPNLLNIIDFGAAYVWDNDAREYVCREFPEPDKDFFDDDVEDKQNNGKRDPIPDEPEETDRTPNVRPVPDKKPRPAPPPVTFDNEERRPIPRPRRTTDPLPRSIPPSIPLRRLPPLQTPVTVTPVTTQEEKILTVEESAFQRFYGCMLHSPVTDIPVVYRICRPTADDPDLPDQKQASKDFFEILIKSIKGLTIATAANYTCKAALILLPTNFFTLNPAGQLVTTYGCALVGSIVANWVSQSENAKQSISGTASINVKYIEACSGEEGIEDVNEPNLLYKKQNINDCFVPIRNFRDNEPEQLGMKFQLQITYERSEEILDDQGNPTGEFEIFKKQITIPNPREIGDGQDQITKDDLKSVFPERLTFGEIKAEMDIIPYGHVRFYAAESDVDDGITGDFLDDIVDVIVNGSEKTNSRRFSRRRRSHRTGEFTRKKAFYFKWNREGKPPLCNVFDLAP